MKMRTPMVPYPLHAETAREAIVRRRPLLVSLVLALSLYLFAGCHFQQESMTVMHRLSPCPDSPNCVSTLADDETHGIAPLTFSGSADEAKAKLVDVIQGMPRTKITENDAEYIHVEFTSLIFRFVDDVEFVIDEDAGRIDFRSASRLGYGDMGVNRRRMEEIRSAFQDAE